MKKFLSLLLSCLMVLSVFSCLSGVALPVVAADDEEDTGVETISFAKNGLEGTPYTSGLNHPFGFYFKVDDSKKLLSINVVDMATYSNNVNKGTVKLYHWQGSRDETVRTTPVVSMELVNWIDHTDLVIDVPSSEGVTGELYFEVIAKEGSGYTPWVARGGVADDIPGKVTGMQAFVNGNQNHAFTCEITIADMESRSPSKYITWSYDFSNSVTDASGYGVKEMNQIAISQPKDGYTTFTAEGSDPYFRFPDNQSPSGKASELAYIAIKYRTEASVDGCEIFSNHGGLTWGNDGTMTGAKYITDGEWHVTLVDASEVWGGDKENTLFAFRFDPLASGCMAGESVDVAYLKFFADGEQARSFVAQENRKLENERADAMAAGTTVLDFGGGRLPEGYAVACADATLYVMDDFVRLMAPASGASPVLTVSGLSLDAGYGFARIGYRASAHADGMKLSVGSAVADVPVVGDGFWHETAVDLGTLGAQDSLTLTALSDAAQNEWMDIAYITLCTEAAYRDAYEYPRAFNTHLYALGETDVPVLTCTKAVVGDPYCGPGEYYGQKFVSETPVTGVVIYNHATWKSEAVNAGYFKLWQWTGDYEATVAGTPLVDRALTNVQNNVDLVVMFDELPAGEYCYEVKLTSDSGNAYTGFSSKGGTATDGSVAFRNGKANGVALYSAYMTKGIGLVDLGAEYSMNPTVSFDFTKHIENASDAYGLSGFSGVSVTDLCDAGYLHITADSLDPFFTLGEFPEVRSNLADWIVIKYRTETHAPSGEFFVCRSDGVTWGQDYARSNILFDWIADGEWHIAVVDATGVWGNVTGVTLSNVRFDPLEKPEAAGESIDIAYIRFFANGVAAQAFADSEYVGEGDDRYVPAPLKPLAPGDIHPVLVIDGEKLNVTDGHSVADTAYSYENGYITLTAKADDPFYRLLGKETIARYALVRYRTTAANTMGEFYVGSVQDAPYGGDDHITFNYEANGEWHNAIIDLTAAADFNAASGTVNYLRYDFLAARSGALKGGESLDLECVVFFATLDEAVAYEHTLPEEAATYTVSFLVNGRVIYTVTYREGDTEIKEPVVPKLPGLIGSWEPYELNGNIEVHAVYKPAHEQETKTLPESELVTEPVTEPETVPETVPDTQPDTASDTHAQDTAESTAGKPGVGGCKSLIGTAAVWMTALVTLGALSLSRKKEGR